MARVFCGVASAEVRPWLTVAVVDDSGRLLDLRHLTDDPAGYAQLGGLLVDSAGGTSPVAIDRGDHLVAQLLAAAGQPLAVADDRITADVADRFSDDTSYDEMRAPSDQRRAVGLARALQAGALSATTHNTSWDLGELKPMLAAHGAVAAGRQAAATALREILRELYPAALRAFPDPSQYIPLMILDALPEPGLLSASPSSRARENALVNELVSTGAADPQTAAGAIDALRAAVEESPRWGFNRQLAPIVAETVRQSSSAVRACDAASSALVTALTERLTALHIGSGGYPHVVPGAPVSPAPRRIAGPAAEVPRGRIGQRGSSASAAAAGVGGYEQPEYEQGSYEQPGYEQQYVPAGYEQPAYAAANGYGSVDLSAYPGGTGYAGSTEPVPDPGYRESSYREPQPRDPQYRDPQHRDPQYRDPQYREPQPRDPQYRDPQHRDPGYNGAGYERPGYNPYEHPQYTPSVPAPRPAPAGSGDWPQVPSGYPAPGRDPAYAQPPAAAYAGAPAWTDSRFPAEPPPPRGAPGRPEPVGADTAYAGAPGRPDPLGMDPARAGGEPRGHDPRTGPGSADPLGMDGRPTPPPGADPRTLPGRPDPLGMDPARAGGDPLGMDRRPAPGVDPRTLPGRPDPLGMAPGRVGASGMEPARPHDPLTDPLPGRAPATARVEPAPTARPEPASPADDDLSIFSQIQSAWFTELPEDLHDEPDWGHLADDGWRAADQVAHHPTIGDETTAGLPRRVPQANLVPGSAQNPRRQPRVVRDAQSIAAHTEGYFRGWRRGQEIGGFAVGQRDRAAWEFNRDQRARQP